MTFLELLDGAEYVAQQGNPEIAGVDYDSRRVKPGWCFVAMHGGSTDGNQYIDVALQAGAVAIVSDALSPRGDIPWTQVQHGRRALARLSANFYGRPAEKLLITGVTGTNGKTTTTFLLNAMLRAASRKSALVGTVEYRIEDEVFPAPHTTPEALEWGGDINKIAYRPGQPFLEACPFFDNGGYRWLRRRGEGHIASPLVVGGPRLRIFYPELLDRSLCARFKRRLLA